MEEDQESATVEKREVKPTAKGMEDTLQRKIGSRRAKLSQLTAKKNEMLHLMDDDGNLEVIKTKLAVEFNHIFGEFCELNVSVKELFRQIVSEKDMDNDQQHWFEPKANSFREFSEQVDVWINEVQDRIEEARKVNENFLPSDSVSIAASRKSRQSKASSAHSFASSASSARLKAEMERAALVAQAAGLKQKHALEEQEAEFKSEKEELEINTALAAADAKLKVLRKYEGSNAAQSVCSYFEQHENQPVVIRESHGERASYIASQYGNASHEHYPASLFNNPVPPIHSATVGADNCGTSSSSSGASASPLVTVMQRQNDITEFLVKQQKLSTVPPQNIPVFKGDPLEYKLFIRAFEHGVENKTESSKDRLYFMEQYTSGQARDLVRSCLHMDPDKGYKEAKRLLKEHFGHEYRISMAYISKALSWPKIKTDDGEALNALALFLTSCCNAMTDMEFMEELDNVANMHAIVNKFPYKLREKWRSIAFDIQETKAQRPKFKDLVKFVNK